MRDGIVTMDTRPGNLLGKNHDELHGPGEHRFALAIEQLELSTPTTAYPLRAKRSVVKPKAHTRSDTLPKYGNLCASTEKKYLLFREI